MNVFQAIVHHGADVWGFAGAGFWYTPQTPTTEMVELRGIITDWTFDYELVAGTDTAHSGGEFGVKVISWDQYGGDYHEENTHEGLWAYGCSFWDPHQKDGDLGEIRNVNHTFRHIPGRNYLCMGYVYAYSDGNGYPGSQARTSLMASTSWMVTQDWYK
jgi:hypothetical protein